MKNIIFALVLCLLSISCGKQDEEKPAPVSLTQPKPGKYPEAKAPEIAPDFRWNFSYKKTYIYSWEQENEQETDMGAGKQKYSASGNGILQIKSHGDNTADIILKDIKLKMVFDETAGGKSEPVEQTPTPVVIQGVKDDGTGSIGSSEQEAFLKLLFPLPNKSLKAGESVDMPAQMPFNSSMQVKGKSHITLVRYVNIGSRTCAQLEADIDISELKVPKELKGEYSCSVRAKSVFYFDVLNRCFVNGTISSITTILVDAPPEDTKQPERIRMSMFVKGVVSISLKGTE